MLDLVVVLAASPQTAETTARAKTEGRRSLVETVVMAAKRMAILIPFLAVSGATLASEEMMAHAA